LAERNGTFASTFIEKLQQASSDDRILHRLCQYALHPAHQQLTSTGASLCLEMRFAPKIRKHWLIRFRARHKHAADTAATTTKISLKTAVNDSGYHCGSNLHKIRVDSDNKR
jgi:hypothetical protein